jgi:hypothetical protein
MLSVVQLFTNVKKWNIWVLCKYECVDQKVKNVSTMQIKERIESHASLVRHAEMASLYYW